jgi:hypothetical protein
MCPFEPSSLAYIGRPSTAVFKSKNYVTTHQL